MLQPPIRATPTQGSPTSTQAQVFDGPITRSRAKKLQQEVHMLLQVSRIHHPISKIQIKVYDHVEHTIKQHVTTSNSSITYIDTSPSL